ncbi:MAG: cytochrome P450 [Planctomycetes bacterium]|nr:cytochrome P450 [Planctomycetota bacterium]
MAAPPGPRGYPVVGVLPRIWRDPLAFFQEVAQECGGLARVGLGRFTLYLLSDPALIHKVLVEDSRHYWKGDGLAAASAVMGRGLATNEGEAWQAMRRLLQPAFQPRALEGLLQDLGATIEEQLEAWRPGPAVDVAEAANHLVLRALFRALFGAGLPPEQLARLGEAVLVANEHINHTAWSLIKLPSGVPTPRNLRFSRALRTLNEATYRLIRERRTLEDPGDDLLGRLVGTRDASGAALSDTQIRDELMTLIVAGHETTANALAWILHLLAAHPAIAEQVQAEAPAAQGATGPPDALGRVLLEALRVLPPAWVIVRTPYSERELGGYVLPKGAPLLISQYVVHRDPRWWEEPARFDPDRWLPGRAAPPRGAYFPYGDGPRICIGNHFATALLRFAVAGCLRRFELRPSAEGKVVPQPLTTLRPKGGLRLKLTRRASGSAQT